MTTERKLNIGGQARATGWEVFNAMEAPYVDHAGNAKDLSRFPDGTFSELYASHVLEHFDYLRETQVVLNEWSRVLIPDGKIYVAVPDLEILSEMFLDKETYAEDERFFIMRMIYGGHVDDYDYHMTGFTEEFLAIFLHKAGFDDIFRVRDYGLFGDTSIGRYKDREFSLNLVANKKGAPHPM